MGRGIDLAAAVSAFGAATKRKLASKAASGAPEDQLRAPLETLVADLGGLSGLPSRTVTLVGESTLAHLSTRPDYAVSVNNALVVFIEVKAPAKGADPRRFRDDGLAAIQGGSAARANLILEAKYQHETRHKLRRCVDLGRERP